MVVTKALIHRLAKMPAKDQKQIFDENPTANYESMIKLCNEMIELNAKDYGEQIDDVKFLAGLYLQKQKHKGAVDIEACERLMV